MTTDQISTRGRLAAKLVRLLFMTAFSLLGGVLAAVACGAFLNGQGGDNDLLGFPRVLWLPFLVGVAIANHLARWYSYRYPHRYADPWIMERAAMERHRCLGANRDPKS
jgi:hypothetical protein